jgi:hypothetical protein
VMAQDTQDDGGSYGRWWRHWAVVQDGVVAVAQDDAMASVLGSGARRRGGSARRRGGGGAGSGTRRRGSGKR